MSSAAATDRATELRRQLKDWEREFAAANDGRKADRSDIKANAAIATKYKEYNALRDQIAGKTDNSEYPAKSKRRRDGQARVERERGSHGVEMAGRTSTPRRATRHVRRSEGSLGGQGGVVDAKEKEEEEREREEREGEQAFLATPSHARTMLGPTPQKDGVVLGLFDLLSPQQAERTPSRPRFTVAGMAGEGGTGGGFRGAVTSTPSRAPLRHLREVTGNSFPTAASATIYADKTATPRKHNGAFFDDDDITTADDKTADFVRVGRKTSRTPTSAGKRFLLDSFVTPRKRRRCGGDGGGGGEEWTPSSTARQFMTPQFLKREAPVMETLVEDDGFGLGGVGYGYDDDGNGDGDGDDGGKKKKGMGGLGRGVPSSRPRPWKRRSLGRSLSSMIQGMRKQEDERFDDEMAIMNDMESGGGGRENVVAKQKQNTADAATGTSDKERKTDVVPESQIGGSLDADGFHDIRKDDRLTGEGMKNTAVGRKKKGQKRQTRRVILRPTKAKFKQPDLCDSPSDDDEVEGDEESTNGPGEISKEVQKSKDAESNKSGGLVKKVRKVSEQAHANYRKLKIKNKNSKAGGRGRFGRGRR